MAQTMVKSAFQNEKTDVLGELAMRLRRSQVRGGTVSIVSQVFTVYFTSDDTTGSDPPLPPVFQTYAKQLSGDSRDHEVTSCPARTPAPAPALQSSKGSSFSLHHKSKIHSELTTKFKLNIPN